MKPEIVITGAVRTPIGRFGGGLASLRAADLGTAAAAAAVERAGIPPDAVDQAIFGHARQAGCGPNVARQIGLRAGLWHDPGVEARSSDVGGLVPTENVMHASVGIGVAFRKLQLDLGVDVSDVLTTTSLSAIFAF